MDFLWDGAAVVIAGADTHAQLYQGAPGSTLTGLRFAPGFAPRVLGVPADELLDQHVALDAVWPADRVRRVTDLLGATRDPGTTLETIAFEHCAPGDDDTALINRVVALTRSGDTTASIAERVGLSARQLQRRSAAAFGYGTKTLSRILRMQRALDLIRDGSRAADSAARVGYADQSHLSREVRDLAGVSIGQLIH
jgi:AraC-like DNA-binding protein